MGDFRELDGLRDPKSFDLAMLGLSTDKRHHWSTFCQEEPAKTQIQSCF